MRSPLLTFAIFSLLFSILSARAATNPPTVGMEGQIDVMIPGTLLDAKPVDRKAPLIVRVAGTRPHGSQIQYDLRYIGLVPGKYDVRDFLIRADGSTLDDVPSLKIEIAGILPKEHQGEIVWQNVGILSFFGKYQTMMITLVTVWVLAFIPIYLSGRKKRADVVVEKPREPSLAERLQPYVENALAGKMTSDEQAHLERMLLSHWQQRLGLQQLKPQEAILKLRGHAEAGALLRQLEDWLHRPPGTVKVDVQALLAPYRNVQ